MIAYATKQLEEIGDLRAFTTNSAALADKTKLKLHNAAQMQLADEEQEVNAKARDFRKRRSSIMQKMSRNPLAICDKLTESAGAGGPLHADLVK